MNNFLKKCILNLEERITITTNINKQTKKERESQKKRMRENTDRRERSIREARKDC